MLRFGTSTTSDLVMLQAVKISAGFSDDVRVIVADMIVPIYSI